MWAKKGECGINPYWMTENCRKSCRLCHKLNTDDEPQQDDSNVNTDEEEEDEDEGNDDRIDRRESKIGCFESFPFRQKCVIFVRQIT